MRTLSLALALALIDPSSAMANPADKSVAQAAAAQDRPVTIEYYYRIRWGAADDFISLYHKNHAPILRQLQKEGWITDIKEEQPFTHIAGAPRWDMRVTLTYRNAEAAVGVGGRYDAATAAITQRLYPDKTAFEAAEVKRFSLLEEHWDVIVKSAAH